MDPDIELQHLRSSAGPESTPPSGLWVARFGARCAPGDEVDILTRVKEVLEIVIVHAARDPLQPWRLLLPAWFVSRCVDEPSSEARAWTVEAGWTGPEEAWSVEAWTHHFQPGMRSWWWWDATIASPGVILVDLAVEGLPFGGGALEWLFHSAGANALVA